ncbi:hypothetical protein LOD99_9578 [Oopsacas minuta]|uniref:CCAAT-binding factor domain-containing protein n=1 Tax=Oopsacas minuta TaxID=111878 RepID=A0AAV7KU87_9METZ|nr:hypothetical protein LOD99_9578 [Oopsacas minuta]
MAESDSNTIASPHTDLSKLDSIEELAGNIKSDKLNKDKITSLIELSNDEEAEVKLAALQALGRVFINFLDTGHLIPKKTSLASSEEHSEIVQFQNWIIDKYFTYRNKLVNSICHPNHQAELLDISIQLVRSESVVSGNFCSFFISNLVTRLIASKPYTESLLQLFEKALQFCDVIYCCLCTLRRTLTPGSGDRYSHSNILQLMLSIQKHLPQNTSEYKYLVVFQNPDQKQIDKKDLLKLISKIWMHFLGYNMTQETLILVLRVMDTDILPYLLDPRILLDFLTSSLDAGGVLSILSLKSLVILIQKYKLDYPHIYTKIYSLLTPEITYSNDFGDFLTLIDMVTTSTHLPQYLVAAYIKRLACIALVAPSHSIRPILVIISNLLARHPNCSVMLSCPEGKYTNGDPYHADEQDPIKSNAIDSCLWELENLKHHYCPETAALVSKLFCSSHKRKERSITPYIGSSENYFDKLEKQCLADLKNNNFAFKKPDKDFKFDKPDK